MKPEKDTKNTLGWDIQMSIKYENYEYKKYEYKSYGPIKNELITEFTSHYINSGNHKIPLMDNPRYPESRHCLLKVYSDVAWTIHEYVKMHDGSVLKTTHDQRGGEGGGSESPIDITI